MELNVMTFNLRVHVAVDGDNAWPYRVKAAARVIMESGAAVVGTQEGTRAMLDDLSAELEGYSWIGRSREAGDGTYGEYNAVFYRNDLLTVRQSGEFWLSETPDVPGSQSWEAGCPRICTWVLFETATEPTRRFVHFNTHLDHLSQEARQRGAALVLDAIERQAQESVGLPMLLTGDFNAYPADPEIAQIRERQGTKLPLADAYAVLAKNGIEPGLTYHAYEGGTEGQPIDYIFATNDVNIVSVVVDQKRYDGRYPSDHYPILATVRF